MSAFDKILGYRHIKNELEKIADILKNPEKYKRLGVYTPRGALIWGDPGLGKTLMAKCLIEESGRKSFTCRKDKPDGEFVNYIRSIFEEAEKAAPSIVFLDDMDKFANEDEFHRNAEEFVTIQSCIDEARDKEVFVLATVNDLDNIPDSLLRNGRFDKSIHVENPKLNDAVEIVRYYLSLKNTVDDVDPEEIANIMNGASCADLETIINEAGVYAGYQNKEKIEREDLIKACLRVLYKAPEYPTETYNKHLLEIAYHEAGHAVVSEILNPGSVNMVSASKGSGDIGGLITYTRDEAQYSMELQENIVMTSLGGKAATEIVYGMVDVGANQDLHNAFNSVACFVDNYCAFGFDKFEGRNSSQDLLSRKDSMIAAKMDEYYQKTKKLLIDHRELLDKMAFMLVERNTITRREIHELMAEYDASRAA